MNDSEVSKASTALYHEDIQWLEQEAENWARTEYLTLSEEWEWDDES